MKLSFACALLMSASLALAAGLDNPFYAFDNIATRPGPEPLAQKLDELKAAGYAGLSWSGTNVAQTAEVVKLCEERGLKLFTTYIGMPLAKDSLVVPPNMDAIFETLAKHGTVIWVFIQNQDKDRKLSDPAGDAIAVPGLQALADRAAKHSLKLALYPHAGFWAQNTPDCIRIARAVNKPNLGISFNLCHSLKAGEEERIPALLTEAKPFLFAVSINGADSGIGTKGGWDRLIQPVGKGTYDLAPLLKHLRSIGYTGPIGFQGYAIKGERKEILRETMEGWKKINAGL